MLSGLHCPEVANCWHHMCVVQVQQLDIRSGVKLDLLQALTQVAHTGVYGLEVRQSAVPGPPAWCWYYWSMARCVGTMLDCPLICC